METTFDNVDHCDDLVDKEVVEIDKKNMEWEEKKKKAIKKANKRPASLPQQRQRQPARQLNFMGLPEVARKKISRKIDTTINFS